MSVRRAFEVLRKDLKLGPRSPIFLYALVFPILATGVIQLVFGSLFDPEPRFGIVDEGRSEVAAAAESLESVDVRQLVTSRELRRAVERNDVDAGVVLPPGFDDALRSGKRPELQFLGSGESLARNRAILGGALFGLLRDVVGRPSDVSVEVTRLGDGEDLPVSQRLIPLLVMFAMLIAGLFVPAASLVEEKEKRTLSALLITPVGTGDVLLAKGALGLTLAMAAGIVTLALNRAFGSEPATLVLILLVAAVMALEFGLVIGSLARDSTTLFTVIKAGNILLMAPVIFFIWPDLPGWVARLFPTYYFLGPLFEVAVKGTSPSEVRSELVVAIAICLALVPVVWIAGRRLGSRVGAT